MQLTHEQKLSLLQQLIKIASADGEYRDQEYDMLHMAAEYLQVEPMEMEALFSREAAFKVPAEEARRIAIFYQLLKMVWADNELNDDEVRLLKEFGVKLGHSRQAIDTIIERSSIYPGGNIPTEEIIRIFQVHHN